MTPMASCSTLNGTVPEPASLGTQATLGAFWTILFSALNKLVTFGGQIALAWFLLPEDMGLAGMALSVASIVSIVSGTNLTILLIQRKEAFEENASEIFWLSLAMNLAAALFLVTVSPLAGHLFEEPRVVPVILILAGSLPLLALPTVYTAQIYRDLRFRALAQVQFGEGLIRNMASVGLAALGFGAYSLVLPQPAGSLYTAVRCHALAGRISIGRPHPRRWPALLMPVMWMMFLALATALQTNGVLFVIGMRCNPAVVGFYSWGFALSSQAIFLLGVNLQRVFFPVFSELNHDSERQSQAFCKACKILIVTIVPICALQIVLARPVIELLFQDRWLPAVPVVQWLSMGMMTQPLTILGTALLLARGQYRLVTLLAAAIAFVIATGALLGTCFGREAEIARCTGTALFFTNAAMGWIACRELKRGQSYIWRQLLPPVLLAVPLIMAGTFLVFLTGHCHALVSIAVTTSALLFFYGCGIWFLSPHLAKELMARIPFFSRHATEEA